MLQKLKQTGALTASAAAAIALAAVALDAPAVTPGERQILEDFFMLADGENWRRKDGWLDPEIHPCSWYGIECHPGYDTGDAVIRSVLLPGNQLGGTLDTRIFEIVRSALDLSDNRISGPLERLPSAPGSVDLSGNQFSGPLPSTFSGGEQTPSGGVTHWNWYLDLSNNRFEGEVPPDWRGTTWLSLAGNRLEGMPTALLGSELQLLGGRFLDLSDNRFSGPLPLDLVDTAFMPHNGPSRWGGGLNLCWNDFQIEDGDLIERIGARHVGGANFLECLNRERQPLDAVLSGSWFDPERSGEGVVFHQLADDRALLYWFTFDAEGQQRWLVGSGQRHEFGADWRELKQTRGGFDFGLMDEAEQPTIETRGGFRLDHLGNETLMAERSYIDTTSNVCLAIYPPPLSCFGNAQSDRLSFRRATELAGTTCDSRDDFEDLSGAWFSPERDGEGFLVEVMANRRAVVYWFTYLPDDSGAQAWMLGVGRLQTTPAMPGSPLFTLLTVNALYQPLGARFGADFDPSDIELFEWGELVVGFDGPDSGWVEWNSHIDAFGAGGYPIERLTRPVLAECGTGTEPTAITAE